ncbi:MAG: hypothetical protein SFV23_22560, partial [Planctomycetaceae bacterium]|nr:hypothetical protein [Planctomycetaceae bacterium]
LPRGNVLRTLSHPHAQRPRRPRQQAAAAERPDVFICFASIGLPGLNGFVGEVLALAGMFKRDPGYAALGALGVVLGAWYLLGVLQKAFFGALQEPHHDEHAEPIDDLNAREILALLPLAALCLYLGLFPQTLIDLIQPDIDGILQVYADSAPATTVALELPNIPLTPAH